MSANQARVLRAYCFVVCVIIAIPILAVMLSSFTSGNLVLLPPSHWGLRWYGVAISNFGGPAVFSLETALVVAAGGTAIGVACAYGLVRKRFMGWRLVEGLVMAPLFIPHIMLALGIVMLMSDLKIPTSPLGLVIGQILVVLPFVVRFVAVGIGSIDRQLEYAAESLGATPRRRWFTVTLPLAMPSVVAGAVMAFLIAFDESVISLFTSEPGNPTLPVAILNYTEQQSDPGVSAISTLMVVLAVVCVLILERTLGLVRILAGQRLRDSAG